MEATMDGNIETPAVAVPTRSATSSPAPVETAEGPAGQTRIIIAQAERWRKALAGASPVGQWEFLEEFVTAYGNLDCRRQIKWTWHAISDLLRRHFRASRDLKGGRFACLEAVADRTVGWGKIAEKISYRQLSTGITEDRTRHGALLETKRGGFVYAGLNMAVNTIMGHMNWLVEEGWLCRIELPKTPTKEFAYYLNIDWPGILSCLSFLEEDFAAKENEEHRYNFIAYAVSHTFLGNSKVEFALAHQQAERFHRKAMGY
jgi:hypothetical protein